MTLEVFMRESDEIKKEVANYRKKHNKGIHAEGEVDSDDSDNDGDGTSDHEEEQDAESERVTRIKNYLE